MNELSVLQHEAFLLEGFLADGAVEVFGRVDVKVRFLMTVEVSLAAQKLPADPTDELLPKSKV